MPLTFTIGYAPKNANHAYELPCHPKSLRNSKQKIQETLSYAFAKSSSK
jgi:hypothetical protein